MSSWKKALVGITFVLIVAIAVVLILGYKMLTKSLAGYDGEKSVMGISAKVTIYRDRFGIPLIKADNDEDAAFALGYVHAQERLFQMDILRRAGEGKLSQVFGNKLISIDKLFRTLGIYQSAKTNFPSLNDASKRILLAYSKGVNSFLKEAHGKYPVEFDILGYDPEPWKPEHSMIIAKLMGWELNISWWTDIVYSQLVQKFGEQKAKELIPDYLENAPTIIPSELKQVASIGNDLIDVDRAYRNFVGLTGTHIGSNNWVVNGLKSASGKPMIANDPHLGFTAPARWYFAMIRSNNWNADGFTIAGLPSIVIGKNQNIAWAMTNVMADDADFFSEKIDSTGRIYFIDGNWKPLIIHKDTIKVKNEPDVIYEIRKTSRGPIVSDVHQFKNMYSQNGMMNAVLSMRWTGFEFSDEIYSSIKLNRAKNWDEFKEALRYFTNPGQNFVYADRNGNIGYVCAAKLPIRATNSPTFVMDGTSSATDWKGFVPYDEMPKLFNPPQNFIASANNKTVKNFPYHISNIWEPSSRIERITELLTSKTVHSVDDFEKYQMDFVSPYAKRLTSYLLEAFKGVTLHDKNLKLSLELLGNWDFEMNAQSQVPTIYNFFLKHMIKNILSDELPDDILKEYVFIANVPYRKIIEMMENGSSFFDDIRTPQIETRDDIIRKSLSDALSELEENYGADLTKWQWGQIHKVVFKHMFHDQSSLLDKLINVGPFEIGGDGTTIFNTEYSFPELFDKQKNSANPKRKELFENKLGPSMRYIYDFGDPDYFYMILPTGESGYFMNSHYKDMAEMWLRGKYIKLPLNENEFIRNSNHSLTLLPN